MPLACTPAANCTTLDQLATTTASASAPISSGEKLVAISCVRQVQQIEQGRRAWLNSVQEHIPLFDRNRTIPSSRPAIWQSAARSGSQGCRRECGGIGGAGAQRPWQSEHGARLNGSGVRQHDAAPPFCARADRPC
jgi:hypothetical protein